jgi:hypothetical protein
LEDILVFTSQILGVFDGEGINIPKVHLGFLDGFFHGFRGDSRNLFQGFFDLVIAGFNGGFGAAREQGNEKNKGEEVAGDVLFQLKPLLKED